jgi:hypothetical protein
MTTARPQPAVRMSDHPPPRSAGVARRERIGSDLIDVEGRWIVASRKFCRNDAPPPILLPAKGSACSGAVLLMS